MLVYTSITAGYDSLKEQPKSVGFGVAFRAFVDGEKNSETWRVRPVTSTFATPRLNAKYYKVLPHKVFPEQEYSLWVDGSVEICPETSILDLVDKFLSAADLAVFAHDRRNCLYQEAAYCIMHRKDDSETIFKQVSRYTQASYPANNGLAECSILLRRHTKKVKAFNELWWREILAGSFRDQISFPYAAWKTGVKVEYIPGTVGDGSLFLRHEHLNVNNEAAVTNRDDL
jgi:hypothetical protein